MDEIWGREIEIYKWRDIGGGPVHHVGRMDGMPSTETDPVVHPV